MPALSRTRATASGWKLQAIPLGQATASGNGSLDTTIAVPDNLGGWHTVQLLQGGKVKAELPYDVLRSFVSVTPKTVKEGEVFTIHLKGIGWSELDNTNAITDSPAGDHRDQVGDVRRRVGRSAPA